MFEFQRELFPLSLSEPVERTREVTAEKTVGLTNGIWRFVFARYELSGS
jgi:hypothetical protein